MTHGLTEDWAQRRGNSRWTTSSDQNDCDGDDEGQDANGYGGKCKPDADDDSSESNDGVGYF